MPKVPTRLRRAPRLLKPLLRPAAYRILPRDLRARHVGRLAAALPDGVRDAGFEVLLKRIDDAPLFRGQAITPYFDGPAAFAAMRAAIVASREEILLEAYILKDDATGRAFLDALAAAAGRGVAVRVLADAWGSMGTHAEFWAEMRAAGIEVRLFHPLFPALWFQPYRDHRKILVVDRHIAFTGGMNVADDYGSSSGRGRSAWRDTHARLEGSAAWEMAVVFSEGWDRAGGRAFEIAPLPWDESESPPGASVLVLDSSPGRGHAESASVLAAIVGAARDYVFLTNAYFAPARASIDILGEAAARGVDVRLLLPGTSDVPLVRHAGHGFFRDLLRRGLRIFEYQPSVLHAKTVVADGLVSVVGSSNMDFRSFHFNAECNLVLLDEATAGRFAGQFLSDLDGAAEILEPVWSARPWPHRLGDRAARALAPLL
jgi:cardiolipin synthase